MMNPRTDKPLLIFFALSIGFILLIALPGILANFGILELDFPVLPLMIIGSWTPNIAALLVIAYIVLGIIDLRFLPHEELQELKPI